MSTATLTMILPLARAGWRLFPLLPKAKTPAVGDWPTVATTDETRLKEWDRDFPACNWGMATGAGSGVFVVDIDGEAGGAWLADQIRIRGEAWAETRKAKTARGLHLFFAWPGNGVYLRNSAGKIAPGVDVRGAGGFVAVVPSIHPSGAAYEWLTPANQPLLDAPAWLLALATSDGKPETPAGDDVSGVIPEGQRNTVLASIAGAARRRGTSQEGVEALLLAENRRCRPPLPVDEVRQIAASIATYPPAPASPPLQLLRTEDGKLLPIFANAVALLRDTPEWAGVIGYDEFAERAVLRKPAPGFPAEVRPYPCMWADELDAHTLCWLQRQGLLINGLNITAAAIGAVAREKANRYHPVIDYLEGLVWDGDSRVDYWLINCFGAKDTPFVRAVSRRWLISAVARVFQPGCQADHMLMLLGVQGIKKSSGLRALTPRDAWFADSVSTLASKDSRMELRGKWLIELSELDAMRRAEVEAVKAFISERVDHYRPSYGRHVIDAPRQCAFAGSTNADTPLLDAENRRFWPVKVGHVDVPAVEAERNQLWAEAVVRYKSEEAWWLETEELEQLAKKEQDAAYSPDPWDERVHDWLDIPTPRSGVGFSSESLPWNGSTAGKINIGDVLTHCIGLEFSKQDIVARKRVARLLHHLGYRSIKESAGTYRNKRYYIKEDQGQ